MKMQVVGAAEMWEKIKYIIFLKPLQDHMLEALQELQNVKRHAKYITNIDACACVNLHFVFTVFMQT